MVWVVLASFGCIPNGVMVVGVYSFKVTFLFLFILFVDDFVVAILAIPSAIIDMAAV
jgi:hypothetical protein